MRKTVRFSSLFLLLAFGAGCGGEGDVPAAEEAQQPAVESTAPVAVELDFPEGVTAEMVAAGEAIFTGAGICFTCHMPGGVGGPLAPNLTDNEWINTDGSYEGIVQTVTAGVPEPQQHPQIMLPKGGTNISDEDVRAVASYVWSLSQGS